MQRRKLVNSIILINICLLMTLPVIFTNSTITDNSGLELQAVYDDKERSVILFKREEFHNYFELHYYRLKVKEGATYHLHLKLLTALEAALELDVEVREEHGDPVVYFDIIAEETANWNSATSPAEQVIDLYFTAETDYVYSLAIAKDSGTVNEGKYTLYFNQTGFAGLWWIILSGIGILALVLFLIIGIPSITRKKKSKSKKKKKKKR